MLNVLVFDLFCHFVFHLEYSIVEYLLDLVLVCLRRSLRDLLKQLVLAALCQMLKLAFQIIRMKGHFLVPSTVFDDKALRLPLVAFHVLPDQFPKNHRELIGNFLNRLLLELLDIANNSIVRVLSDKLELSIKAVVELRHEHFYEFFLHFPEDFLVVLLRGAFVVFSCLLHYLEASLTELLDDSHIALRRQSLNLLLHLQESLILDLPAPIIGDHFSLAWQVKFFLLADDSPRSFDEEWHAVERHVLRVVIGGQEDRVSSRNIKPGLQLASLFSKCVRLEDLVRHHDELESEELLGL